MVHFVPARPIPSAFPGAPAHYSRTNNTDTPGGWWLVVVSLQGGKKPDEPLMGLGVCVCVCWIGEETQPGGWPAGARTGVGN